MLWAQEAAGLCAALVAGGAARMGRLVLALRAMQAQHVLAEG